MNELLIAIKNITVFLLAATLLAHLFSGTEYRKYILYAAGLMVIALALAPILSLSGKNLDFGQFIRRAAAGIEEEDIREQMELLGQEREAYLGLGETEREEK